jgi:hypothetical protein
VIFLKLIKINVNKEEICILNISHINILKSLANQSYKRLVLKCQLLISVIVQIYRSLISSIPVDGSFLENQAKISVWLTKNGPSFRILDIFEENLEPKKIWNELMKLMELFIDNVTFLWVSIMFLFFFKFRNFNLFNTKYLWNYQKVLSRQCMKII